MNEYKDLIKSKMGEERFIHSLNVSKEAVKLAKKYKLNVNKAELAGLLHDITKEMDINAQIDLINKNNIKLDETEKYATKLFHAISGSIYIKNELKINDEEILSSIRYHTTGKKNMSMFEKIIFVADFISAERSYPGIEKLRQLAYIDLDIVVFEKLKITINKLVFLKVPISYNTILAYNQMSIKNKS